MNDIHNISKDNTENSAGSFSFDKNHNFWQIFSVLKVVVTPLAMKHEWMRSSQFLKPSRASWAISA